MALDSTVIAAIIGAIGVVVAAIIGIIRRQDRAPHQDESSQIPTSETKGSSGEAQETLTSTTADHIRHERSGYTCYSAPACVFLAGEHAVMFGHTAVYLPLPRRLHVRIEPDTKTEGICFDDFVVPDPDQPERKVPIDECRDYHREIGREEERKLSVLFRELILPFVPSAHNGLQPGFRFSIDSDFPVACGMNASGAIADCIASAFVDCFLDLDRFRAELDLADSSSTDVVRFIAWLIENCFHGGRGSGAGVTGALAGRTGLHPIIYFPGKRSLMRRRIASGWPPVAVGEGRKALRHLAQLGTYMFDPSVQKNEVPAYDPPPEYHISLLYSGNPSKTGDVLRGPLRKFSPRHGRRVAAVQNALKECLAFDMLSNSVRFHAQDVIESIYLDNSLSKSVRDEELEIAYHEMLCESMGATSILMMNSVLWDWAMVPQLMASYQSLLKIAGVSNSAIDGITQGLLYEAIKQNVSDAVAGKITGCGRGGDVLVVTVNKESSIHDAVVDAVVKKTGVPVHFTSTTCDKDTWSHVPGVRRE